MLLNLEDSASLMFTTPISLTLPRFPHDQWQPHRRLGAQFRALYNVVNIYEYASYSVSSTMPTFPAVRDSLT